jgi:hypothetical protein
MGDTKIVKEKYFCVGTNHVLSWIDIDLSGAGVIQQLRRGNVQQHEFQIFIEDFILPR